jgi:hypothetical protein
MKKKSIFVLEMLLAFSLVLIGCDLNKSPPSGQFTVIIVNNSSYPITAYSVVTNAGYVGSAYIYTSPSFIDKSMANWEDFLNYQDPDETYIDVPTINVVAGATSDELGPFKILFRDDKLNASHVGVSINYQIDGDIQSKEWYTPAPDYGFWEYNLPSRIILRFSGADLTRN